MSRNRQKPKKFRGPSRPVDPRYLPGVPKRKGPDPFALGLIGVSTAFVLIIILFVAFSQNSAGTTASNSGGTSGQVTNPPVGSSPVAGATMTAMEVDFLTKTVGLPRISDADAKALLDSGKATFIDVRNPDFKNPDPARAKPYDAGHIKGAIYIPTDALMTSLSKVPKDRPVILYCE